MELGFLIYRGVLFSLQALPQVAPPQLGTPTKLLDVLYRIAHWLGVWLIETDLKRYIQYENDVQAWVSGACGSQFEDLAASYLPIRATLQAHLTPQEQLAPIYHVIAEKEETIARVIAEKEETIARVIAEKEETIAAKQTAIDCQQAIAEDMTRQLHDREQDLRLIHSSRGWRLLTRYYAMREQLLPPHSRRRLLAKVAVQAVRHPLQCWRRLSWENLKKFVRYARTEGAMDAFNRMDGYISRYSSTPARDLVLFQAADVPEKMVFTVQQSPRVSIIVPVYNAWAYTRQCLYSILQHTEGLAYEVIVADDVSTDETVNIDCHVENVRVIRPAANLGFLKNCNQAALQARGEFIVFLNNDTQVQPKWLEKLTALIDRDPQAGLVGSKLIYPDGRLQEAGGIVWRDASGWNYGRMDDPAKPEYNYVKPVDYISGAAIMIRTSIWREIGGFDERYAPAYYEDTDLAFAVRERGYQVMYQPASVVVHFEGVSNGTDVASGAKRYQKVNQQKFHEKWQHVLTAGQFLPVENLFLARDRSQGRKTIVVVDHYVPHFDRDAGGRCTYTYIKLLLRQGLRVIFVGDNYFPHQPYTAELEQLGVEVLYGPEHQDHFGDWLQKYGKYIDYAYLNRPHIAVKYIGLFRCFTNAKVIYFGHDLHFLREMRQYELEKNPALLDAANRSKEQEMKLFQQADVVHVVGAYEERYLRQLLPEKPIRNIPLYVYTDEELDREPRSCADTAGLLFVGGFGHHPNADGILWFVQEVWPAVLAATPQVQLTIVGSNPPPAILALASSRITVTGYVSDAELADLYRQCRIAVVPLRFGAGVKGKVVEAVFYRAPVVTTPIGAEGLPEPAELLTVAETATAFAEAVVSLYRDETRLQNLSDRSGQYIRQYFSTAEALRVLQQDIQ
jgi:GT2 family glycosyltransferase